MRWGLILSVLGAGCLGACNPIQMHPFKDDLQAQVIPAVYCYNNLVHSPDCYDVPLEPEVRRLMGYYGPDPVNRGFYGRRAF